MRFLFFLLSALSLFWYPSLSHAQSKKPNVVIVLCDDMGWGDVAYHGSNKVTKTPNLDAMAKSGVRFTRSYSSSPLCSPTRAGLMSGRFPTRYGCYVPKDILPANELTIAKLLRMAGYRCGHFGKWHIGGLAANDPTSPGGQGFHEWFSIYNSYRVPRIDTKGFNRNGQGGVQTKGYVEDVVFDEATKFIRASVKQEKPFLAVICTLAPHSPHQATDRLRALFPGLPEEEQHYWGMIHSIDENMGRLRDELRKLGVSDDTIVIFTSDNGGTKISVRHAPFAGNKGNLWEGGLRVPGLLEWPRRYPMPFPCDAPMYSCDILPTVIDAAGVSLPKDAKALDGISLLPVLDGKKKERPTPIVFHFGKEDGKVGGKKSSLGKTGFVVLDNNYRLLMTLDGKEKKLFDLSKDIGEKNDIASKHPDIVARLSTVQRTWWESVQKEPGYTGTKIGKKANP